MIDQISIDEVIKSGRREASGWGLTSYKVPKPYLRPRVLNKGQPEPGKGTHFVTAPGDGPEYKFSKTSKGGIMKNPSYGKDAKEPPASYLPLREWAIKKDKRIQETTNKKAQTGRGSFIDTIFSDAKKYNYPGPNKYFETAKKDRKDEIKPKETKKIERPNFLYDCEYLGMNNPGPGSYHFKDPWNVAEKKRITSADSKTRPSESAKGGKRGKGNGPGQYEIVRLLTVREEKGKSARSFVPIPIYERPKLGIINKVISIIIL
jgi:hypothetical protein